MMRHICLPMQVHFGTPAPFPLQALNPSRSATLEQAGEDSLKAKDPETEKVSSEQARSVDVFLAGSTWVTWMSMVRFGSPSLPLF